jgi:hypothetical protein
VEQTGVAFSTGLKRRTRYVHNPVIPNDGTGSVDEIFASDPCVLKFGRHWALFYYSRDQKGVARDLLALSPDLRSAVKCDGVLIDVGLPGSIDDQYAHKPSVICPKGVLYRFYCAASKNMVRGIGVAASKPLSTRLIAQERGYLISP